MKSRSRFSARPCSSRPSALPMTSGSFRCCRGSFCREWPSRVIVFAAPENLRIIPACPLWIERGLLLLAGLWFVNLVNFMDGLDLMTAAEIGADHRRARAARLAWRTPASTTIVAAALCGAMLGFAPFNRPVAQIFLGDVGSLPIGLLLGWCLLQLAWHQQFAAALLLPLYYLADATVTLLRRMVRREPFWAAHRTHFYQRATDNGFTVWRVVRRSVCAQPRSWRRWQSLQSHIIGHRCQSHAPCRRVATALSAVLMRRFSRARFVLRVRSSLRAPATASRSRLLAMSSGRQPLASAFDISISSEPIRLSPASARPPILQPGRNSGASGAGTSRAGFRPPRQSPDEFRRRYLLIVGDQKGFQISAHCRKPMGNKG